MQIMHFVRELTKRRVCGRRPLWTLPAGARGRRILALFGGLTSHVYCLTPNQLHDLNEMNGLHERRPRPADETGSREWRRAPIFTSIILDAPEKLAKRKRIHFLYPEKIIQIMQIMHFVRELTKPRRILTLFGGLTNCALCVCVQRPTHFDAFCPLDKLCLLFDTQPTA